MTHVSKPKTVTLKIPNWINKEKITEEFKKLLEEKYGIVSIESLRRKFKIKTLREDITVNEEEILSLRKKEKKRLQT